MTVELRHLRHFVAVADAGQISAAARRLHLAQPALTQSIQALERAVGAKLFRRHARGVDLTPAGERFLAGALTTLQSCDDALAAAREVAPAQRTVLVGAVPAAPQIGGLIASFRRANPDIPVRWEPLDFARDGRAVADGDVDVGFALPEYTFPGVESVALHELAAFFYVSSESPLAGATAVRFEDVADEVYLGQSSRMADEFADLFYLTAIRGHRPRLSATPAANPDEAFALVASGAGVTPGPYHRPPMWPHAIARVPTVDIPPFTTRMLWRTGETDPATLAFVRHVITEHNAASARLR